MAEISSTDIQKAYARWAPVYDLLFGSITTGGRKAAVKLASKTPGKVLEVGVGTGMALPLYPTSNQVIGLDLSLEMLQLARKQAENLPNIVGILQMDAGKLAFPDESFDSVAAMYLITVVPDPEGVMAELARVTKKGGSVILINHFSAEGGIRAFVEKAMSKYGDYLGWRPEFPFSRVLQEKSLTLIDQKPAGWFGLFTLLHFKKEA